MGRMAIAAVSCVISGVALAADKTVEADRLARVVIGAEHCPYLGHRESFVDRVRALDIEPEMRVAMRRHGEEMRGGVAPDTCRALKRSARDMGVLGGG